MFKIVIVGGGAAGIFAAIAAKSTHPSAQVIVLEKSAVLLAKVRVSGGGRCNVTHACFEPKALVKNYPRGEKELLGPFHQFQPQDTIEWFESRGVPLKTEADGRMFPITNRSETIIECLLSEAQKLGVEIRLRQRVQTINKTDKGFELVLKDADPLHCDRLILATGSSADGLTWAEQLGHCIQKPVPSLFTFNVPSSPLKELSGIAIDPVELQIKGTSLSQTGPLLLTHFGFSGPAALKLSAWGARALYEKNYQVELIVNWLPQWTEENLFKMFSNLKARYPQKTLLSANPFSWPKRLWETFLDLSGTHFNRQLINISSKDLQQLSKKLQEDNYLVEGKTTHKEEFVTCGGVSLKEINFKTMESKLCSGLFFTGEILDIDGVTGGFNFQNAWTTAYIAGHNC
jgi:predicted Rossmann fold flavoprotein